ncbi:MAG TPA: DUF1569 domain-containing protein [Thermoanaerobaculia bacterium]|nr:DUF1569 domain-containing protein [Thermoanaerobaculia bacterium]
MKTIWQHDARLEILRRIDNVNAEMKPLWGKMTATRMLRHLAQSMFMATGELPVKPKRLPIRYFPLKQLAIYVLPFAKGLPTAPELLEGDGESVEAARADLHKGIESVLARKDTLVEHPVFGTLTTRAWGVLAWRHMDHHLRQFGV